jgi:hypothetical protein
MGGTGMEIQPQTASSTANRAVWVMSAVLERREEGVMGNLISVKSNAAVNLF